MLEVLEVESNDSSSAEPQSGNLAIKVTKGKLELPGSSVRSVIEQVERAGITVLPIANSHILRTESLPHHHRDPFDRLIIAQAQEEELTILTSDSMIPLYDVPVIWH